MTNSPAISSQASELGAFRNTFLPRELPGKVLLGSAIFCIIVGIIEFTTAINKYFSPPSTILSDRFRQDSIMIAVILGVVFVILTLSLLALYNAHRKHRVDLYDNGMVISTWRGQKTFLWGDLMKVDKVPIYGRSSRPVNWNYTLYSFDGTKTEIRGLEGLSVLGRVIEKHDE